MRRAGPHYSTEEWADYARGLTAPEIRAYMQAHLERGCERCRNEYDFVSNIAQAAVESMVDVPDQAVHAARALFQRPAPTRWIDELKSWTAELISQEALEMHPAGVRSLAAELHPVAGERLLYRAGDYTVDLKLSPPTMAGAADIVGQISNSHDDRETFENVVVQLEVSGRILAETPANRYGEFLLSRPGKHGPAVLRLGLRQVGGRIEVPLRWPRK